MIYTTITYKSGEYYVEQKKELGQTLIGIGKTKHEALDKLYEEISDKEDELDKWEFMERMLDWAKENILACKK